MLRPLLLVTALATIVLPAAPASALPGDPPIVLGTPAPGATVPGSAAGISVTYACPRFHPLSGVPGYTAGPEAYFAGFATDPALDATGQLDRVVGSAGATDLGDGTCASTLTSRTGAESSGDAPEIVGGLVHWQVVRVCGDCLGGAEISPVQSFTITPQTPEARLVLPQRAYDGYRAVYEIRLDAQTSGVRAVVIERRAAARWRQIGSSPVSIDTTTVLASLPRGRQTVRLRALVGATSFVVDERQITVKPDANRTTSGDDDGRLRDRLPIDRSHGPAELVVAGGGRKVRTFSALIPATCVLPNPDGLPPTETLTTLTAVARDARIAPDGSVAAYLANGKGAGSGYLTGRLRDGTFRGVAHLSAGNCAGSRKVTATP